MVTFNSLGKVVLPCAAVLAFGSQAAMAGVGIDVNINLGQPPRQVVVAPPPPVYAAPPPPVYVAPPQPVYVAPPPPAYVAPPTIVIQDDVQFVYPDPLGFYVAVGVPYDLFYVDNVYFVFRGGHWFRAPSLHGPWVVQRYRALPPLLRRNRLERIREYRTREYVVYKRDPEHYRGRQFRYDKARWNEQRRGVRDLRHQEREFEKQQRQEDRRLEREQRKEERHSERENRRDHWQ